MSQRGRPAVLGASCGQNPQEPPRPGQLHGIWLGDHSVRSVPSLSEPRDHILNPSPVSFPFQREPGGRSGVWPGSFSGVATWPMGTPRGADTFPQGRSTRAGDGWVGGVLSPALPKKQKIAKAYGFPPGMEARLEGRPVARIGG